MTDYNLRGVFADSENPPDDLVEACRDWAEVVLDERDAGDQVAAAVVAAQRQRSTGKTVVAWFKDSALGEDDDRKITGTLVEETDDEIVLEREVTLPNLLGDGPVFKKKTVRSTVQKDALRNHTVKA